jgi:DNA-binding CsgD family transcriptional regulator
MPAGAQTLPPLLREAGITRREADVLEALGDHLPNNEIAARLSISVRTVESHVSALLAKLHVTDRNALGAIARRVVVGPASSGRLPLSLLELAERGVFVGRHDELGLLRERWAEATTGRRRVVVIQGEAGIGKSRLVAELAVAADRGGALVLLGHCDEEAFVAYQPVVEALTALVESQPAEVLAGMVRGTGAELVRLLPGLARFAARTPAEASGSADMLRYSLFEAVANFVAAACQDGPVLLVLEDLHWADQPTLQLVKHMVRRADRTRLFVLGTIRGTRLDGHLLMFADDLRREHGAGLMQLRGLGVDDIVAMAAATPGPFADLEPGERTRLATRLHRETSGNPFFVAEVLRHRPASPNVGVVPAAVDVPDTVRDAIVRRVEGLADLTRHVLSVAAVAGRRFRIDIVTRVAELSPDRIVTPLEEAQACGILDEATDHPGWLEFSHALVREILERELSTARRRRLHRLLGETLQAGDASGHAAELAYHFHAAATPHDYERAVSYAIAAAEQATAKLAYERAAELYAKALEALALAPSSDRAQQFELLLLKAGAYRRGGLHDQARRSAVSALEIARQLADPERLADAALAVGDSAAVWSPGGELVEILESALQQLDQRDLKRRARLLARLAQAEYYSAPTGRRENLSQEAVAVARAAGDDATLASVLSARHIALWGPTDTHERLSVADEIVAIAERRGDRELAVQGHAWRLVDLLELGRVAAADHAITAHARLARDLGQPLHIRDSALWAATRALLDGRFDDADRETQRALSLGKRAHDPHAEMFWWAQRYWLVLEQDASTRDIADLLDASLELAERYRHVPAWRGKIALLHARLGDRDAAAAVSSQLSAERLAALPRDAVWLGGLYYLAEVAAFLSNREQAATLYELLRPFSDRIVVIDRALVCLGSVSRVLGLLAGVLADRPAAVAHLRHALARHEAMGARPLTARTRIELAHQLRHDHNATAEVAEHVTLARGAATELGMTRLLAQISELD